MDRCADYNVPRWRLWPDMAAKVIHYDACTYTPVPTIHIQYFIVSAARRPPCLFVWGDCAAPPFKHLQDCCPSRGLACAAAEPVTCLPARECLRALLGRWFPATRGTVGPLPQRPGSHPVCLCAARRAARRAEDHPTVPQGITRYHTVSKGTTRCVPEHFPCTSTNKTLPPPG
jgi:hypothetical protein